MIAIGHALGIALLLSLLAASTLAVARPPYPFEIEARKQASDHLLIAKNRGPAPVSVKVELDPNENTTSDRLWPLYAVVPPLRDVPLARIFARESTQGYGFRTRSIHAVGDYAATHDPNARYRMPFEDGRTFTIGQTAGGPITTHTTPASRHAVDIPMPEGTPVVAARDGVVIETESSHTSGGTDESLLTRANFVRVLHADGTIASYVHLAHRGVSVGVGQPVRAGMQLGLSGSTGYSSGPHLHFSVSLLVRADDGFTEVSVPVEFYVGEPPHVFQPETGLQITGQYLAAAQPQSPPPAQRSHALSRLQAPTDGSVPRTAEAGTTQPATERRAPQFIRAHLMTWQWWQWFGLIVGVWLVVVLLARNRSAPNQRQPQLGAAALTGSARKTRLAGESKCVQHPLSALERLVAACSGDRRKAERLMEDEYRKAPEIRDDEAAMRALARLAKPRP